MKTRFRVIDNSHSWDIAYGTTSARKLIPIGRMGLNRTEKRKGDCYWSSLERKWKVVE